MVPTQAKEDAAQAFLCARNCLLYEADPGPALVNVGSSDEPRMIPRDQAWQHAYALHVVVACAGDHARLTAAARQCREDMSSKAKPRSPHAKALARAADLCDQAARMAEDADAVHDDKARRRLVASCEHETMVIALGVIPGVAQDSAENLLETFRRIDEEP
ncbi:MAG TPA: hypothetical protein VK162_02055 [Streptosporangiaceae bacterium]|nr:hypothetical protein [Streptosporangiaceae bacterium]